MAGRRPRSWPNEFKRLLQSNLGRSRRAQDLLFQTIRESEVALAVVAEPYRIPDATNWVGDLDGLAAIIWITALCSTVAAATSQSSGMEWRWWAFMFLPTAAWSRSRTSWTGLTNASEDAFPARTSGISTPTPRRGEILGRTLVGEVYPIELQDSGSYW